MTPQEIFDKAYLGLKAQGKVSRSRDGCMYSAPSGERCGVGHLVDPAIGKMWDTSGDERIYGTGIDTIVKRHLDGVEPWMEDNIELLDAIQCAHDGIYNWQDEFERVFANVAKNFLLVVPK